MAAITSLGVHDVGTTEATSTQNNITLDPQFGYEVRHTAKAVTSGADEFSVVFASYQRRLQADGSKSTLPTVPTTFVGAQNVFMLTAGTDMFVPPGNDVLCLKTSSASVLVSITKVPHYRGGF